MVIKEGYKQTEIGVIPMDWEEKALGEIGESIIGLTYSPKDVKNYGTLVLRSSNVQNNKLAFDNNVYVEMELPIRVIVKEHDMLICVRNGSKNLIGKCALIDKETEGKAFGAFMSIYRSEFSRFVFHQFQANIIQRQINETMGATINQLTNKDLASFKIPLPTSLAEQTAISTALSDADGLITGLEKLIAKKLNIKQGAMQQLLQPKEGWEVKKLVAMTKIFTKQTGFDYTAYIKPSLVKNKTDDTLPFIQNKDFNNKWINLDTDYFIPKSVAFQFPNILLNEKSLLISISGSVGNVGVFESNELAFIGGAVAILKFKENSMIDWVMLYLKSQDGQKKLLDNVKSGSHQNLILDDIRKIEIPFPSKEEQIRISKILFDMDAELSALEQKLEKYKKVKLGMMQELLTGKTRLV